MFFVVRCARRREWLKEKFVELPKTKRKRIPRTYFAPQADEAMLRQSEESSLSPWRMPSHLSKKTSSSTGWEFMTRFFLLVPVMQGPQHATAKNDPM